MLTDIINGKYEWKLKDRENHLRDRDLFKCYNFNAITNAYMDYKSRELKDEIVEKNFREGGIRSLTNYLSSDGNLELKFLDHLKQGYESGLLGKNRLRSKTIALETFDRELVSDEYLRIGDIVLGEHLENGKRVYTWEERVDLIKEFLESKSKQVEIPFLTSIEKNYLLEILSYVNSNKTLKSLNEKTDERSTRIKSKLENVKQLLFEHITLRDNHTLAVSDSRNFGYLMNESSKPKPAARPYQTQIINKIYEGPIEKAFFNRNENHRNAEIRMYSREWNLSNTTNLLMYQPLHPLISKARIGYNNLVETFKTLMKNIFLDERLPNEAISN